MTDRSEGACPEWGTASGFPRITGGWTSRNISLRDPRPDPSKTRRRIANMQVVDEFPRRAIASPASMRGMTMREERPDADLRLLQAMADGDRGALARLYDRHAPALLALGSRMLGSAEEAEDLVQDILLEAWRRAGDYDPARGSVRTWLAVRTRSRALDRLRAAGRQRIATPPEGNEEERPEPAAEPAEDPSLAPDRRRVRHALAALPASQRVVLEMGYYEGLTSAEIAARVNIPIGTVKSRVAAALSRLREALRVTEGGGE
jgi:RNA polymerase sigma-70 factor (ECF subfamily)